MSGQYAIKNNVGTNIAIPETAADDVRYFTADESAEIRRYYDEFGYVVIRNAVPPALIDAVNAAFDREVLPSRRFIYRQATAKAERHVYTDRGFMLNSILNPQSVDPHAYPNFRNDSTHVFALPAVQKAVADVLGEKGKLVQGMYFHGNPATWPHQDSYYLDSETIGTMTAVWIAMEDIAPGAGRFFIYPKSQKIALQKHGASTNIATKHGDYKQNVVDIIRTSNLECRAPALNKGDLLFWNAWTIHGSLPTTTPDLSRRSLTAHFIPASERFLQFQVNVKEPHFDSVEGALISRPKDQAKFLNRVALFVESRFPGLFNAAKRTAIRLMMARHA